MAVQALAVTVTKFLLEPVELMAASVRKCFVALLDGLPLYMWPVVLGFVVFMCPLALLVWRGYGLTVPFFFSISLPDRRATAEIRHLTDQVCYTEGSLIRCVTWGVRSTA